MKTRLLVGLLVLVSCGDPEGGGNDDPPAGGSGGSGEDGGMPDGGGGSGGMGGTGGTSPTETCASVECDVNATCSESGGMASCACNSGYSGDGDTCADIDECEEGTDDCDGDAACVNLPGSFRCLCDEGLTGDGTECSPIQVNECGDADLNTCDPNAECDDTAGGFECECPDGYDGDGKGCEDVDECDEGDDDCVADSECINTFGSFKCECSPGFEGDGKDECNSLCEAALADTDICSANGVCRVAGSQADGDPCDGSEACISEAVCEACEQGYVGDGVTCTAAGDCPEECDGDTTGDVADAICTGGAGTRSCECAPGFEDPDGGTLNCVDEDECATSNGGCGDDEQNLCTNLDGGFVCSCQTGYAKDGSGDCVDVNECNLNPGPCHPNATCDNNDGGFDCECNDGFEGDGTVCTDIDECEEEDDDCLDDGTARCVNTNGDFQCQCRRGYEGDGSDECTNIDECEEGDDDCADDAECMDTTPEENPFGYVCTCPGGQSGDGTECSDLDECNNASLFDCPANSQCVNTDGGYDCECGGSFAGDDAESCYCDLSGYWAMRQDLDICWCDQDLLDVTIIGAGSAEATIWELHKYTYDGEKIVVEKKGCGEDNEPDLVSPLFEGADSLPETYASYVPRSVYDDFDLQPGKTIPEAGIVPGTMFTTPEEAAVVGIDLGDDPEGADWPNSSASVDEDEWVDSDGDGQPGFTIWSRRPSERTEARTVDGDPDYFDYPPVDLCENADDPCNATGDISERTACQSVATRVITKLESDVESCERIVGNIVNVKTEGRVHSCLKVARSSWEDDIDCDEDAWSNADPASGADDDDGDGLCDDSEIERLDDADQSQQSQASFELVKIGNLDDEIDCDDVRKALPAISRSNPSPISCNCP